MKLVEFGYCAPGLLISLDLIGGLKIMNTSCYMILYHFLAVAFRILHVSCRTSHLFHAGALGPVACPAVPLP
jgi:hypothetical protein